jgi:hypothetical protein
MAMRGEDVIGLAQNPNTQQLLILKTEAKSRATLSGQVVAQARAGLDKEAGCLPATHSPIFQPALSRSGTNRWRMRSTMPRSM